MPIPFHTLSAVNGGLPAQTDRIEFGLFPSLPFAASANSITAVGAITAGTGFTNAGSVVIAPTGGTGSGFAAQATSLKVVSAAVATGGGGSGYVTNDTLNMGNGVTLTVTATAGVITALAVTAAGSAARAPTNPVAPVSTSGVGVGASINLAWGLGAVQITNSGNYSAAPTGFTVTDTNGGGTGASIAAPTLGGAGAEIIVGVSTGFVVALPYAVWGTPSVPAFVRAVSKTNTGFSLGLTPIGGSSTTLAAGTIDALLLG